MNLFYYWSKLLCNNQFFFKFVLYNRFWNMKIRRIKRLILSIAFLSGFASLLIAQGNLPYVDQKQIHFGFSLGLGTMDFAVSPPDSVRVSSLNPTFSVGIITDLRLNRYLNLRFTPALHFGARELTYTFNNSVTKSLVVQSLPICLPVYLKYSSERKGNLRPYVIWGGGASIDLATNEGSPVLLKPLDFFTEFGAGCDIYFSFFKLCPELKYSIGFNNMYNQNHGTVILEKQQFLSVPLTSLTSHVLTLAFNFE